MRQDAVTAGTARHLPVASPGTTSDVIALPSAGLVLALTAALVPVWVAAGQASGANLWGPAVLGLGFAAVGFAVARRQPANPVGWLFLASATFILAGSLTAGYALLCYRLGHGGLPLGRPAVAVEAVCGTLRSYSCR